MRELLANAIDAHGGIERWQELAEARATIVSGGLLFDVKGLPQDPAPREMTVRLHEEHASVRPFGSPDQRTDFTPGRVSIEKLDGRVVTERDEVWRGLRAAFPSYIASHSTHQDFYFGPDHRLRRHDYHVDVAGGFATAQYVYDCVEADGIVLPTKRRAYRRDTHGRPIMTQLMVSIDLSEVTFS
ncbi:hypothetical protein ACFV1F_23310 [Streptomyces sp. NPDC059590]|uniref:hypothetical protein n=1 Tax=Streptomyces sp. NPDC059590 TaxID=3346877 RepID=UPI0036CB5CF3